MKEEEKIEETPFNMAMLYYKNLNEIREKKTQCLLNGDYKTACECLNEIFTAISFKLEDKETTRLKDMMDDIDINLAYLDYAESDSRKFHISKLMGLIRDFDREALKLMHRYKMIFPKVQGSQGLNNLKDKYSI